MRTTCILVVIVILCLVSSTSATVRILPTPSQLPTHIKPSDDPFPKCLPCQAVAELIAPLVMANTSRAVIFDIAVFACEIMKPDCNTTEGCKDLCLGVVREHMDEVLEVILKTALSPPEVCYLLKMCPQPPPPPKPSGKIPVPSNCSDHSGEREWPAWKLKGSGYFVQLSDIHVDPKYKEGMNSVCGQPLCCREVNGPGNASWNTAGKFGSYNCDSPPIVVESIIQYIASLNPPPDFVLYTGDDVPHDIWEQSREWNLGTIAIVNALFAQYLPGIPVFSAIGNHEAYPVNQFQGPPYDSWLYDQIANGWAHYLPNDAIPTLKYAGYYTARVRPGLRVISLNTNFYMSGNFWLKANYSDFSSQLVWTADVLRQARALKEQVIFIGHAATSSWENDFAVTMGGLMTEYADIIVGGFYGHAHCSDVRVWRDNVTETTPISIGYVVGSVVPYQDYNFGWRHYYYSRDLNNRWLVQDFDQHWVDIDLANSKGAITDLDKVQYSAKSWYNLTDLSPASWQAVLERMLLDDGLFSRHMRAYYKGAEARQRGLPDRLSVICDALSSTDSLWQKCYNPVFSSSPPSAESLLLMQRALEQHHERENSGC